MHDPIDTTRRRVHVRVRWAWPLVLLGWAFAVLVSPGERDAHDEIANHSPAELESNDKREAPEEDEDA